MKTKNILICVSGLTPQIVTETLFCLAYKEKIPIDEVYVLTTKRGRDVILGRDIHPATPKTPLKSEIENLCKKYKLKKPLFEENGDHIIVAKEESIELSDIRSDKDNILFPNKICEFLRVKSSDPNNVLYCSITGGRKSMSVHLANALSLFARENDRLVHVLTKEEHEFKGFYPLTREEINDLELADIPFVRLRSIISDNMNNQIFMNEKYDRIVEYTQERLKVLHHPGKMILRVETKEFQFDNARIEVEPLLFTYYYKIFDFKQSGTERLSGDFLRSTDFSIKIREFMKDKFSRDYDDHKKGWWNSGFGKSDILQKHSRINDIISNLIEDPIIADQFKISSEGIRGNTKYYIKAKNDKFRVID